MYWNINRGAPPNKDPKCGSAQCESQPLSLSAPDFRVGRVIRWFWLGIPANSGEEEEMEVKRGNGREKKRKFPQTLRKEREVKKKRNEGMIEGKVTYPISHTSSSSFKQTFKIFNFFFVWPDRTNHQILFKYILPFVLWNTANFWISVPQILLGRSLKYVLKFWKYAQNYYF